MKSTALLLVCIVAFSLVGCSDPGPVDSGPISISINSMNESDIENGVLSKDENISNGTSNPWGIFIKDAEAECESDPQAFETVSVRLELDTDRSDITGLEDVITGGVAVYFASTNASDENAVRVDIAAASSVSGVGPITLTNLGSRPELQALWERLVGGDFHVGLSAGTNLTPNDSFSATIRVIFDTRAHCE